MDIPGLVPTKIDGKNREKAPSILRYYAEEYKRGITARVDLAASLLEQSANLIEEADEHSLEMTRLAATALKVHRWNVDKNGDGTLSVCRHEHEKHEECDWEEFVPKYKMDRVLDEVAFEAWVWANNLSDKSIGIRDRWEHIKTESQCERFYEIAKKILGVVT